jgi:hypothetical protein
VGDIGDKKRKTIEVLPVSVPEPAADPARPAETPRAPVPATPSRASVG